MKRKGFLILIIGMTLFTIFVGKQTKQANNTGGSTAVLESFSASSVQPRSANVGVDKKLEHEELSDCKNLDELTESKRRRLAGDLSSITKSSMEEFALSNYEKYSIEALEKALSFFDSGYAQNIARKIHSLDSPEKNRMDYLYHELTQFGEKIQIDKWGYSDGSHFNNFQYTENQIEQILNSTPPLPLPPSRPVLPSDIAYLLKNKAKKNTIVRAMSLVTDINSPIIPSFHIDVGNLGEAIARYGDDDIFEAFIKNGGTFFNNEVGLNPTEQAFLHSSSKNIRMLKYFFDSGFPLRLSYEKNGYVKLGGFNSDITYVLAGKNSYQGIAQGLQNKFNTNAQEYEFQDIKNLDPTTAELHNQLSKLLNMKTLDLTGYTYATLRFCLNEF